MNSLVKSGPGDAPSHLNNFCMHHFLAVSPHGIATKPAQTPFPDSLTARELEVLQLIALGLTNPQVAEHLILSRLTVNTHVRSIYSKLGVTSRSAATIYAIKHKLI